MLYFFVGLIGAIISATPPGPINIKVTFYVLCGQTSKLIQFLLGVVIADLIVATIAVTGVKYIFGELDLGVWLEVFGGVLVISMGVLGLRKNYNITMREAKPSSWRGTDFLVGLSLCLFNPGFLIFWTFALKVLHEYGGTDANRQIPAFLIAIILGNIIWFVFYSNLLKRLAKNRSQIFLDKFFKGLNGGLIGFGCWLILRAVVFY